MHTGRLNPFEEVRSINFQAPDDRIIDSSLQFKRQRKQIQDFNQVFQRYTSHQMR